MANCESNLCYTFFMNKQETRLYKPEYSLCKKLARAVHDYQMIAPGDRILVGFSGGKDSFTLIQLLEHFAKLSKNKFEIIVAYVHSNLAPSNNKQKIAQILKEKKLEYHLIDMDIKLTGKEPSCFWCSWNRRTQLFILSQKIHCNKIALGHHKDDFAQTALLNLFFQGKLLSMDPCQEFFKGKFTLIRPMMHIDESEIIHYVKKRNLPTLTCNCPSNIDKNRKYMKEIINHLKKINPKITTNILNAEKLNKKNYIV